MTGEIFPEGRGSGRTASSLNDLLSGGADESAPKRRGRPRGSTNKPRQASAKEQAEALLNLVNAGLAFGSPEDALNKDEMEALAQALADDPWTAKYLTVTGRYSAHANLVIAVALIAIPRMQRHGIIPSASEPFAPVPMEAGGAYGNHWGNGFGQDDAGGANPNGASALDFVGNEA